MVKIPLSDILKGNHKDLNHMSKKSVERVLDLVQQPVIKQVLIKEGMIAGGVARKIVLAALGIQEFPDYSLENRPRLEEKDIVTLEKLKRLPYVRIDLDNRENCCKSASKDIERYSSLLSKSCGHYNDNAYDSSLDILTDRISVILCSRGHFDFTKTEVSNSNLVRNIFENQLSKTLQESSFQAEDIDVFFTKRENISISDYLSYEDRCGKKLFNSPFSWNFFLSRRKVTLDPRGYDSLINNLIFLNKEFCSLSSLRSGRITDLEIDNEFSKINSKDYSDSYYKYKKDERSFEVKTIGAQSSLLKEPLLIQLIWNESRETNEEILDSFDSESLKAGFFLEDGVIYFTFSEECISENKSKVLKFKKSNNPSINRTIKRIAKYSKKTKIDIQEVKDKLNRDILFSQVCYFNATLKKLNNKLESKQKHTHFDELVNAISLNLKLDKIKNIDSPHFINFFTMEEFLRNSNANFCDEIFCHFSENYEKAKKANFKINQLFEICNTPRAIFQNSNKLISLNKNIYNFLMFENGANFLVDKINQGIEANTIEEFYEFIDSLETLFPNSELCDLYLKDTRILWTISEKHKF